jgi:hypothetical protein
MIAIGTMIAIKTATGEFTDTTITDITTVDMIGMTGAGETAMTGETAIAMTGAGEITTAIGTMMETGANSIH